MSRKHLGGGVFSVVAAITFCSSLAFAYILPADAILSSVCKRRAKIGLKSLVVEGTVEVGENAPHPLWVGIVPGKAHRIEHKLEGTTLVEITIGAKRWRHNLGEPAGKPEIIKDDLIMTFLGASEADPGGKRGTRFAERLGIDTNIVSLARHDGRPAFIIGAKPWEPTKPQLWIDKEMRVPVRLIRQDGSGGVLDTRFGGFGSPVTGEWFPRHIEEYENGNLVRRSTYDRVKPNEPLEPNLFEPPAS